MAAIVVTYRSADVIGPCLESLLAQDHPNLSVIIVDNASPDDTAARVCGIMQERDASFIAAPFYAGRLPKVLLIRAPFNRGFAAGCNIGLEIALATRSISLFWLINPDCEADPGCASAYAQMAEQSGNWGLLGGRTCYAEEPALVQSDGGQIGPWTAVCRNVNQGLSPAQASPPPARSLDYFSGANVVASRTFVDQAGPMAEDYFLYYEEVDWALRRGDLALIPCPAAIVRHRAGSAAGSGAVGRQPSAFSNYFNYRNRLRFAARHRPASLPGAYLYSMLKIGHLAANGYRAEAAGALRGLHGLPPNRAMQALMA
ncbi:MAG: glycosyltransferase family 2 protein [Pseudomonadota bacterium]